MSVVTFFRKEIFLNFYALYGDNFHASYIARIFHLASQTMYFRVSDFLRYCDKTTEICCYGLIASYFTP